MTGRDVRKERCGRALGRRHERVFGGGAPGEEPQLGAITGGMPEVSKGRARLVDEHAAEARAARVEACGFGGVDAGVGREQMRARAFAWASARGERRGRDKKD